MSMPFEPEEIDDLDESLLETMDREELAEFKRQLQDTLDGLMVLEPDPDDEEVNVLNDMIDAIDDKLDSLGE